MSGKRLPARRAKKSFESLWKAEDEKFGELLQKIRIPNATLDEVDRVILTKKTDFEKIPWTGGSYWIWTNEPIRHRFHKNRILKAFGGGEIIYNGIAKDNVGGRIRHHLLGDMNAGWSGISVDIYPGEVRSHKKKACSPKGKVPYVDCVQNKKGKGRHYECVPVRDRKLLLKLRLSSEEKTFIINHEADTYHFRNGINIFDNKHKRFKYTVYFIVGLETLYLEFLEKRWRQQFGLPRLCSYSSGR